MPKNETHSQFTAGHIRPAWTALPNANVLVQDPNTTNATTGTNTVIRFFTPFVISYERSAELASAHINTDIYTVPTGFALRVLDCMVSCRDTESSDTIQLRNNTTAIFTAIAADTDKAITRPTAGFDDAAWTLTAGQKLNVLSAGGTNGPACNVTVLAALVPA